LASVHDYKRLENSFVQKIKNTAKRCARGLLYIFKAIGSFLTRRYTVVIVPHSEKKVYNLHVTILSLCCFFLIVSGILGAFIWTGISYSSTRNSVVNLEDRVKHMRSSLDEFREETVMLLKEARRNRAKQQNSHHPRFVQVLR